MKRPITIFSFLILLSFTSSASFAVPAMEQPALPTPASAGDKSAFNGLFDQKNSKDPTYINSDMLTVRQKDRVFIYSGNVVVTQADLKMTSETLEGTYAQNNEIEKLIAKKNVHITKGPTIKADSNQAVYEKASDTLTLTENPQLEQDGSTLLADKIKIFLKENRSEAQGQVRVKLIPQETPGAGGAQKSSGLDLLGGKK